jgi:hypothetical protein
MRKATYPQIRKVFCESHNFGKYVNVITGVAGSLFEHQTRMYIDNSSC